MGKCKSLVSRMRRGVRVGKARNGREGWQSHGVVLTRGGVLGLLLRLRVSTTLASR